MLFIAISGIALAAAGLVWHTEVKREKERQLLFVGEEFRQAIVSYYDNSPQGARQFPLKLEDLLRDQRFPVIKRHLRRIYQDPMTGTRDWGLMREGGRIVGIYSQSQAVPLKTAGFSEEQEAFAKAESYRDWQFVYVASTGKESAEGSDTPAAGSANPSPATDNALPSASPASSASGSAPPPSRENLNACLEQRMSDTSACSAYCMDNKGNSGKCMQCNASVLLRYRACMANGSIPSLAMP